MDQAPMFLFMYELKYPPPMRKPQYNQLQIIKRIELEQLHSNNLRHQIKIRGVGSMIGPGKIIHNQMDQILLLHSEAVRYLNGVRRNQSF